MRINYQQGISKPVVVIAVLAVVVLAGVLAFQYWPRPAGENGEPADGEPADGEEAGDLDTSGWQTFRNEDWGFEVKYPPGWYSYEETESIRLQPWPDEEEGVECAPCARADAFKVLVLQAVNLEEAIDDDFPIMSQYRRSSIVLDNLLSVRIDHISQETELNTTPHIYFIREGQVFQIRRNLGDEQIFEQILSTFKFID